MLLLTIIQQNVHSDLCMNTSLQVGTSSVVYPAAMFAPQVAARGVPVAEFNMEDTPVTKNFMCVSFLQNEMHVLL